MAEIVQAPIVPPFRALHEGWNRVVEDVLRVDIERGLLRADLDPRAGARIVTSFIMAR